MTDAGFRRVHSDATLSEISAHTAIEVNRRMSGGINTSEESVRFFNQERYVSARRRRKTKDKIRNRDKVHTATPCGVGTM